MPIPACSDRRPRGAFTPLALLALIATAGCAANSEMTNLWKDPAFTSGPERNVLVVALRKDPVRRRLWEDAFAKDLSARGVAATVSYQLFPQAPPDTQDVIEAVRKNGYEAVLVSSRLPDETKTTVVPGAVTRKPVMVQDYMGRFHTFWQDVQDPDRVETDEVRRFQTDLWTTKEGGHLIWSGTLRTLESVNNETVNSAVSRSIVPVLEKQGLVPAKPRK